jgi:hypothetical protein
MTKVPSILKPLHLHLSKSQNILEFHFNLLITTPNSIKKYKTLQVISSLSVPAVTEGRGYLDSKGKEASVGILTANDRGNLDKDTTYLYGIGDPVRQ